MAGNEAFLDVAHRIAMTLCRDAIRDGDRCNWLGDAMESANQQVHALHRSFRGDLYGGTSGIAVFLAQTHRFRPDPVLRDTALGAIEQASRDAPTFAESHRVGFYTGVTGIGFAAARVGEILDEPELVKRGLALVEEATVVHDESPVDVLSGAAGIVGPLLALHAKHQRAWMLDRAVAAGEVILRRARSSDRGVSWSIFGDDFAAADLTGYSHGAAGIALALLELAQISGDERFRTAAEGALQYERSWFSPENQNWPDLRRNGVGPAAPAIGYSLGWCHGAPGIGMSRLRAYELLQREDIYEEAGAALRGTYAPLATLAPNAMFALCHGAAGNAELFLEAFEVSGDEGYLAIAEAIGRQG
ncbi:MAG TPA: lanthionine synthetase LanC family protein, partial [Thermoanaerobaculia bacterium]|nr:lanthionine synthetase LanC family protein [Thermoanaerobaculia bacterium]